MKLRQYQQQAIDDLRQAYGSGRRAPLFVLPTGGGKTFVFTHLTQLAVFRGNRVLILVHRAELLDQASRSLSSLSVDHGLVSPRHIRQYDKPVQVASVQTLVRRLNSFPEPDLIIIDEAHHAVAGTWDKICKKYANSKLLGVTATPCRSDGAGLHHAFDDLVMGPSIQELIDDDYLVKPRVFAPTTISTQGMRKRGGDFATSDVVEAMDKPTITGDAIKHYRNFAMGRPAIAFCASVSHAEHVAAQFNQTGINAKSISGLTPDDERRDAIQGLRDGALSVLTSCDIISEGTDIPRVECAILLRPTQSLSLYLQQVGRVLRPFDGKQDAIILDHVGNVMRHGLPNEDRDWTLDGGAVQDAKPEDETVKQCEKCFATYRPQPVCPECGHQNTPKVREIQEQDGELQEITEIKRQQKREVGKARTLEELQRIERERGYKRGWAYHVYHSRQRRRA